MKSNASIIYNVFLAFGDLLALIAAFVGAFILRVTLSDVPIAHPVSSFTYLKIFLILLPFWILIFALLGLYNSNIYERRFSEFGRLLVGSFIGLLFVIFYSFISVQAIFPSKLVPIYGFGLGFVFLLLFRNIARSVRTMLFSYNIGITNILVVGNTAISDELRTSLRDSRKSGYRVLAVVGDRRREFHTDFADFQQALSWLDSSKSRPSLNGIIQTELYPAEERNREILDYAQEHHISYRFIPGNTELFVGNIDVELFRSSVPVIAVRQTALFGWGRVVKRLFDLFFGSILLILSSPLWLLIALGLKIIEPGAPVFYKAKRLTRFGNVAGILKFRTMRQAYNNMTPEEGFIKMGRPELIKPYRENGDQLADDPRVGRYGRFLRATSLDEIPQLFNVVHGEISLVGPRALDIFEMEKYSKKNLILSVKSGLTGLAIVSGRSGISFEERRKLDLYYVQNWSFWLDIVIIVKTIRVVYERLWRRGVRY
jgi:exopolysaccharide biosynthesis polyprenyl glycosylphosphotransferase